MCDCFHETNFFATTGSKDVHSPWNPTVAYLHHVREKFPILEVIEKDFV